MKNHVQVLSFESASKTKANFPKKENKPTNKNPRQAMYQNNKKSIANIAPEFQPQEKKVKKFNPKPAVKKEKNPSLNKNSNLIEQDDYEIIPLEKSPSKNLDKNEEKMINTIKMISENRMKFRQTNKVLREIGQIAANPKMSFLTKNNSSSPTQRLSNFLNERITELDEKKEVDENILEDDYLKSLERKIKNEIRQKGAFDFSKLSDADRKLLAQKKLYDKMKKEKEKEKEKDIETNNIVNDDINNENIVPIKKDKQITREEKKENFFKDLEKDEDEEEEPVSNKQPVQQSNEKPTARQILENVLSKIEYKNQVLVNHNQEINKKIETTKKSKIKK